MSKTLKVAGIIALIAIGVLVLALPRIATPQEKAATSQTPEIFVYSYDRMLRETNRLRSERGLEPLVLDERLNQSAQWKAEDMKENNYAGHVRDGYHGYQKAGEMVAECVVAGENLAWHNGLLNPYAGWRESKSHYEAIVNEKYDITGFGYVTNNGHHTYVQHFCDID